VSCEGLKRTSNDVRFQHSPPIKIPSCNHLIVVEIAPSFCSKTPSLSRPSFRGWITAVITTFIISTNGGI
jgi:hypothetical protein